jgi:NAD-dependent dihydropyrimidine dehydrogenase PreA subunit
MVSRKIVHIDEEKCTGCGLCVPRCAEGALKIIDGKARLVSETYCDGLGACLGECPVGAITVEERDAEAFDEEAVRKHLGVEGLPHSHAEVAVPSQQCSSAKVTSLNPNTTRRTSEPESKLSHWPIQIMLVPPQTSFLRGADLAIVADCVPFAYANFHSDFLEGKALLIGCPKLDDIQFYKERLAQIFRANDVRSVTVVNMEVPCCFGLYQVVRQAIAASGKSITLRQEIISIKGKRITPLAQVSVKP